MGESKKEWYVLHAISGKEAKVKEILDAAIKNTDLGQFVSQVLIPTEKVYTNRNGKKVLKEKNLYSGYVFVEAELTGEVIYTLRNTTNVIDFLRGRAKTSKPEPLRETEVKRMLGAADELNELVEDDFGNFIPGEHVTVTYGPFNGFKGEVKEVNKEKKRLKVVVTVFGRPTEIELENSQVDRE